MAKYLIVNADDFGFSENVNNGIITAHKFGIVSSATMLVTMPGFKHAVRLARQTPSLGVGLHLNLTQGIPLSDPKTVPSLLKADGGMSARKLNWRDEEVEQEIELQLAKLLEAGITPTHMDSHHHFHLESPSAYRIMKKIAAREGIPIRLHPWSDEARKEPLVRSTDRLILDTYDSNNGPNNGLDRLLKHVEQLQDGTAELMCHPGYPLRDPHQMTPSESDKRGAELRVLTNPLLLDALHNNQIVLIHYGQLALIPETMPLLQQLEPDTPPAEPAAVQHPVPVLLSPPPPKRTTKKRARKPVRKRKSRAVWRRAGRAGRAGRRRVYQRRRRKAVKTALQNGSKAEKG
jgi:predicted glycoside hydrolase/deacetylase ChbG (UPF0249 family)